MLCSQANVFLGDRNQAVIADYGIAHHFNSSDFTSAKSTGTVRWTGPEVISLPPHPSPMPDKLDIFALGMTMLEVRVLHVARHASTDSHI
jgi:serine/threonine protein kinase